MLAKRKQNGNDGRRNSANSFVMEGAQVPSLSGQRVRVAPGFLEWSSPAGGGTGKQV